ncbi:MAG: glycosyltransferase family 2 protein [Alphaproteobacteria bacterium]|nr:glycosyltransferase family 2 protein [Alphaproteobacteria bacterium]
MFKPVIVVPCYNHADAFENFARKLAKFDIPVLVVDDGSAPIQSRKLRGICREHEFKYIHAFPNGGKGAALKIGFRAALDDGYTHALQIDADGQHDINDVTEFLKLAETNPNKMIIGSPVYDASAPFARKFGRKITNFWVAIETLNFRMPDAMCGFRVYPLKQTVSILKKLLFNRMGFDIEILVKLYWAGVNPITKQTRVIYPENGSSNFHVLRDNIHISLMHTYLCIIAPWNLITRIFKKKGR